MNNLFTFSVGLDFPNAKRKHGGWWQETLNHLEVARPFYRDHLAAVFRRG